MIKLDIGKLPEGSSHVDLTADASALGVTLEGGRLESPVEVSLDVNRKGDDILLRGSASVKAVLECGRCLEEYACLLKSPIELWCIPRGEGEPADGCQARENVIEITGGARYVDLADHVRSELLVLVPLKPLCEEACKGLCPRCGANLNSNPCGCDTNSHDSRWDALKKFKGSR